MNPMPNAGIKRLARFGLTTPDAERLFRFYQQAFGARRLGADRRSGSDFERLMDVGGGVLGLSFRLGEEVVELLQFDRPGRPYPDAVSASDLCFQHFAIVVTDMKLAYQRLCCADGWSAISTGGPQLLPQSSGGVTAFKFRDPDGHPLELLAFPQGKLPRRWQGRPERGLFIGIDHSAISVSDTARSVAFYEALGLRIAGRSLNSGCEQAHLDGLSRPQVAVTALEALEPTPHLELLCYRSGTHGKAVALRSNDVAATRLAFAVSGPSSAAPIGPQALIDPDGHHLMIVSSISESSSPKRRVPKDADPPSAFIKQESRR